MIAFKHEHKQTGHFLTSAVKHAPTTHWHHIKYIYLLLIIINGGHWTTKACSLGSATSSLHVIWWMRDPTVDNAAGRTHVWSVLQDMWPLKNHWLDVCCSLEEISFKNSTAQPVKVKKGICEPKIWQRAKNCSGVLSAITLHQNLFVWRINRRIKIFLFCAHFRLIHHFMICCNSLLCTLT